MQLTSGDTFTTDYPISSFDLEARRFPEDLKVFCPNKKGTYFRPADSGLFGIYNTDLKAWLFFPSKDNKHLIHGAVDACALKGYGAKRLAAGGLLAGCHWVIY